MKTPKRAQIENRLRDLGRHTLHRGPNRGRTVWYVPAAQGGIAHRYTLTSGIACMDWWYTLDEAHTALFEDEGIRADNYNGEVRP